MTRSEILQVAKPILFNSPMTQAILDGGKTETRRIVKDAPENTYRVELMDLYGDGSVCVWDFLYGAPLSGGGCADMYETIRPYYQPGDYLYVRETWAKQQGLYWHKAGLKLDDDGRAYGCVPPEKWRPSIHMPKEAARIFLRVTDVRVERLQDITEDGAKAEGICEEWAMAWWKPTYYDPDSGGYPMYRQTFANDFWDSTIPPKDRDTYGWAANPWVFVISFDRIIPKEEEEEEHEEG